MTSRVQSVINGKTSKLSFPTFSLSCFIRTSVCSLKTCRKSAKIPKWKVGVSILRRVHHFTPVLDEERKNHKTKVKPTKGTQIITPTLLNCRENFHTRRIGSKGRFISLTADTVKIRICGMYRPIHVAYVDFAQYQSIMLITYLVTKPVPSQGCRKSYDCGLEMCLVLV